MTAYSVLLGTTLTSNTVWRYFFKAVQRPSLLPKDSAEFRGWYDTLPQTQLKESEAYQAWHKVLPLTQLKESEAYQTWRKAKPQMQSKESEAHQAWHKALPLTQLKESEAYQTWRKANPHMQPKESEAHQAWHKALPQTQLKESEAYQTWRKAWQKANPHMQPKKSEAFREWLQAVRENASQRSVDSHLWFKSKPPTADTDMTVRRSWYSKNPAIYKSRTGSDAKNNSGFEWGAWVGAGIGKFVGALIPPLRRAQTDAINSQTYRCRQCGKGYRMGNLKRDIVPHLSRKENKKCFDLYSSLVMSGRWSGSVKLL